MAKNEVTAITKMTRKAKILNFLKIFGLSFAGVTFMIFIAVAYTWITGGFNPPYVPLTTWYWASQKVENGDSEAKTEFVIDGNKWIELDQQGNQVKDKNGNLVWKQKTNEDGDPIYEAIYLIPNEGCTELDAQVSIEFSSNPTSPILQLVEDDNVQAIKSQNQETDENQDTNSQENQLYTKYNVKINSPIYLRPLTQKVQINGEEVDVNIGGWVKLVATQSQTTTSCWVYVDTAITDLKISLNQNIDSEERDGNLIYNIYPNSVISVQSLMLPNDALSLPSTTNPQGKTSTEYRNAKSIYYQTSNSEIATIDNYGNVTILPNKEGETFSINAYVVAKYNDVGNEPKLQDFEGDPSQDAIVPYTRAFDKIRVWSNTLTFKINEISVESITTGSKNVATQIYPVFETGTITYSNDSTKTVSKNNYFVDLILSNAADESYKSSLLNQIKLYIGYEGEAADAAESIKSLSDIRMNGKKIDDASKYITLEKVNGVYQYHVNEYSQSQFYIFFYYEMHDETLIYDYVLINLAKTEVTSVVAQENAISLTYNSANDFETYSLQNFVTINPVNSTYSKILYFVPKSDAYLIQNDLTIRADIAGKECYAVCSESTDNNEKDYYKITPTNSGKTYIYAAVVRTTEPFDGTNFGDYVLNQYGSVEIEFVSEFINVSITKSVKFTGINTVDNTQNIQVDNSDPDYNFASGCDIFARVYRSESIDVKIEYEGTTDSLENGRLRIELLTGANENIVSISNQNNTTDGLFTFKLLANEVGNSKFEVIYDGEHLYTIGVVVLTTELSGLNLDTQNNQLSINFTKEPNSNIATGYKWSDLQLNLGYNSPKTNDVNFEIKTYSIPDEYVSTLSKYEGMDFTQVVSDVDESVNTIQKLLSKLTLDESVIKVYSNQKDDADAKIIVTAHGNQIEYPFDFIGLGRVLLVAQSITTNICSNPVLVDITIPDVKVIKNNEEVTESQIKDVMSYGELTSIDGHITPAHQINLFGTGTEFIKFVADIDGYEYNLQNLVYFKFDNQTETEQEFVSELSGAKISLQGTHALLTLSDLSRNITENISAYTEFGYINSQLYKLNLFADYKLTENTQDKYYTPATVDLFEGSSTRLGDVVFTNFDYDFNNITVKSGNKLYLPEDFAGDVAKLKTKLPEAFVDSFNYQDDENGVSYYHIYFAINILGDGNNENNYTAFGSTITLKYKSNNQKIDVRFNTVGGYLFSTKITVDAGIKYTGNTKDTVYASDLSSGVNLTNKLTFEPYDLASDFSAEIRDVDYSVNANTSDDFYFYNISNTKKEVQTFVAVDENDVQYILQDAYDILSDEEKLDYSYYYIKTSDVSAIDASKDYFIKNNGVFEFVPVENRIVEDLDNYYEKVYSNVQYYGRETHYEAIDAEKLSINYVGKYYIYNETIANYELASANTYNANNEYYYKKNYKAILEGSDITNVYSMVTITLEKTNNNWVVSTSGEDANSLENITEELDLQFKVYVRIQNGYEFANHNILYTLGIV